MLRPTEPQSTRILTASGASKSTWKSVDPRLMRMAQIIIPVAALGAAEGTETQVLVVVTSARMVNRALEAITCPAAVVEALPVAVEALSQPHSTGLRYSIAYITACTISTLGFRNAISRTILSDMSACAQPFKLSHPTCVSWRSLYTPNLERHRLSHQTCRRSVYDFRIITIT